MFSSSHFSVTMERIEKAAAEYKPEDNTINKALELIYDAQKYGGEPDYGKIQKEIRNNCDTLLNKLTLGKPVFRENPYKLFTHMEIINGKICVELLKLKNCPIVIEEMVLPFLIMDFYTLAARRLLKGDLMALGDTKIDFEDVCEFVCSIDMPNVLMDVMANHFAETEFYDHPLLPRIVQKANFKRQASIFKNLLACGEDALKTWKNKQKNSCISCIIELLRMHDFFKKMLCNVAEPVLLQEHTPEILSPPYALKKLLSNLKPVNCPYHTLRDDEENIDEYIRDNSTFVTDKTLRLIFVYYLRQIAAVDPMDPFRVFRINYICDQIKYIESEEDYFPGDIDETRINSRCEYELNVPWCKPYFLWLDAVVGGKNQEECILPDVLKEDRNCDCFYKYLKDEWKDIEKSIVSDIEKMSLEKAGTFTAEIHDRLEKFLQEKRGGLKWSKADNCDGACYFDKLLEGLLFLKSAMENGIPSKDSSITQIGDYLEYNYFDFRQCKFNDELIILIGNKFIAPLFTCMLKKMEEIYNDDIIPDYWRGVLLERYEKVISGCDFFCIYGEEARKILLRFQNKHKQLCEIEDDTVNEKRRKKIGLTRYKSSTFSKDIQQITLQIDFEVNKRCVEIAEAKAAERKKVLFEMSHSIKNLVASVSEPLTMLQDQLAGTQRKTIENALAGTGLIRDLAVGVHMSMRGEVGAWRKDVLEPGFGATTLDTIILGAVRHAVSNMFDGKYFAQFVKNYFGRDLETFMQAQNEWKSAETAEETFSCINKYFFDFSLDCHDADLKIPIGDKDGTATKFLILFQELFLNAVKYSSFTERSKRFVKMEITITPEKWEISLSNSTVDRKNVKSSGIGLAVIQNFATLFDAEYVAKAEEDTYITNINFILKK